MTTADIFLKAELIHEFLLNRPLQNVRKTSLIRIEQAIGLSQRNRMLNYATERLQEIKKEVEKIGEDYSAIMPYLDEVQNFIITPTPPKENRFF